MSDYGIIISQNNSSVSSKQQSQIVLSSKYPLAKLDRKNPVSFQNIRVFFNNDPPNPSGSGSDQTRATLIYSFSHGYSYTPSVWVLLQVLNSGGSVQSYQQEGGYILFNTSTSNASLFIGADATNMYVYVIKFYANVSDPVPNIGGLGLKMRIYVFVEDVGV